MGDKKFLRTEMIIGRDALQTLKNSTVAVFGVGGVGTFAIEALARSAVGKLILIDFDDIAESNINRQIHATVDTVGKLKVDVMRDRVLSINPDAEVLVYKEPYLGSESSKMLDHDIDYVVDAIDMVSSKLNLIESASSRGISIISAMGAGNKLNPTMLEVSDIYDTSVCPLAKVMRKELKKRGIKELKVVYSKEEPIKPDELDVMAPGKRQTPGSVSFVPSVSGLIIASEVVKDLIAYSSR